MVVFEERFAEVPWKVICDTAVGCGSGEYGSDEPVKVWHMEAYQARRLALALLEAADRVEKEKEGR